MEIGTKIIVADWSNEYFGKYCGHTGTIKNCIYENKYGIKLDELYNNLSSYGYFYFNKDNVIPIGTSEKVLIGNVTKGYKFISIPPIVLSSKEKISKKAEELHITNVVFNNPATIVFWSDGSKTVVKCGSNEAFDEEKGLAMAISKKCLGNKGNYYNEFNKWLPEKEEAGMTFDEVIKRTTKGFEKLAKTLKSSKGDE